MDYCRSSSDCTWLRQSECFFLSRQGLFHREPFSQGRVCFNGSLSPKAGFVSTGAFLPRQGLFQRELAFLPRQGLFQRELFSQGRVCFNGSLSPKAGFVSTAAFLPRQGLFHREPAALSDTLFQPYIPHRTKCKLCVSNELDYKDYYG